MDDLRRRQRQEWVVLALLLVAAGLVVAALRWSARGEIERAERARLDVQAQAVQQILARPLESAFAALRTLSEDTQDWRAEQGPGSASKRLEALVDVVPGLAMLALVDEQGRVRASSRPLPADSNLAARMPAQRVQGALHVTPPFRDTTGGLAIDLVLPLAAERGGGALLATLDADYFSVVMRSVLYAPDMRAWVVHGGGGVILVEPPVPLAEGRSFAQPGSIFSRHRDSGRSDNLFLGRVQSDGSMRLVALRTLKPPRVPMDTPLVLAVSRDIGTVFALWRGQSLTSGALFLLFASVLALALALLQRRRQELQALQREAGARERADSERLALALRGADLGLWDLDLRTQHATTNDRWTSMLGYEPGELSADRPDWLALVHPEDREPAVQALQAHIGGHSESFEAIYRMRHRDGRWLWILDRGKVLERDADGQPLRMVGTHMDISQRMQAEQALRERERQLSTLADALPGPVSRVDDDGRYLFANAAYEAWFGLTPAQVLGRTQREVLGDRRYAKVEPYLRQAHAGQTVHYEHPVHTADGAQRWALVTLVPVHDERGQQSGHFTIVVDITDRKRAEDALRASERKTRALVDNLMVGVVVHAPDTQVLDANPAACRLLGLTLEQMLGRAAVDPEWRFVEEDGTPMALPRYPVNQVIASGQPLSNLVGGVLLPGAERPRWVLVNAFPTRRADGAIDTVLVTFLDITDRREAEFERQALERQLRESQKMEAIGTLAGGIAHDFNNILAAILGNVALARDDAGPAHPVQASLAQIQKAGLRARSLVNQILTFSRRDPGAQQVQPLRTVVEETLELLRATLPAQVRLDALLPDEPVPARADATQLQQVLMNLATNAWHALPERGGRIEIGIERLPAAAARRVASMPPGPLAHLWVRDNGSGMDAETSARIFDPFFTTKPVGQGTGLGLSVVHGIVRAHRGHVEVESAPGEGSTFHLYFPSPNGACEPGPQEAPVTEGAAGGGQHVLYVDDDEVMAVMAERLLQRAGYRVSTAASGAEALDKLRAMPGDVDIIVTDFNMPEMSGVDLTRQIALLRPDLPVVMSTGLISEGLREQAREAGVRALLRKEYSFEELTATVERVLADA